MVNILESRNSITLRYAAALSIFSLFLLVNESPLAAPSTDQQEVQSAEKTDNEDLDAYQLYLAQSAVRHFRKKHKDLENYWVIFRWDNDILLVYFLRKVTFDGEFFYFGRSCPYHHVEYSINKKGKVVGTFCPR